MKYLSVAEARPQRGLRLVLSMGAPNPWCESAKAIFKLRGVPYVPVGQAILQANEDLCAWTGVRNAPQAVFDDEPAVNTWLDIVLLAERLGIGPSLLPDDPTDRALALGLSTEICSPEGFGWSRRLTMMRSRESGGAAAGMAEFLRTYGARPEAVAKAPARVAYILRGLSAQLKRQQARGASYLVGDRVSACDIHWACFSQLVAPLPHDMCPVREAMRGTYATMPPEVAAALDPILLTHRDMIFAKHIPLPLDFMPE